MEKVTFSQTSMPEMLPTPLAMASVGDEDLVGVADLGAVLLQCFALILTGYFSGRSGLISETEAKGLSTFVSYFSLPALIFSTLATSPLSDISFNFIASIFLAKALIFILVVVISLLLTKPCNSGKAGLYAIFCTQSNDFALGYPLLNSLYSKSHPHFARYLYVLAPIQLLILNPVGLFLMELQKQWDREEQATSQATSRSVIVPVLIGILRNPIIIMTLMGIAFNLFFGNTIPVLISSYLDVLANAFSATALFLLGLNMVGKFELLKGSRVLLVPLVMIGVKILVLPLVIRFIVERAVADPTDAVELSSFGFLYGTIPTAPTVFIFALQYEMKGEIEIVATGLVICTFFSAPLMFCSANLIRLLENSATSSYTDDLGKTMSFVSLLSIPCTVWVIFVLIFGRKWNSLTHRCTIALAFSQLASAIGGYLWQYLDPTNPIQNSYLIYHLHYILSVGGILSSRVWTAVLALTCCLLHWRSLCYLIRVFRIVSMVAVGVTTILFLLVIYVFNVGDNKIIDPNFEFGDFQAYVAIFLLVTSLLITVTSLIVQQHLQAKTCHYHAVAVNNGDEEDAIDVENNEVAPSSSTGGGGEGENPERGRRGKKTISFSIPGRPRDGGGPSRDLEDLVDLVPDGSELAEVCGSRHGCSSQQRKACASHVKRYRDDVCQATEATPLVKDVLFMTTSGFHQILSHVILLLLLCLSMLVGLTVCVGKLFASRETEGGIFVELEFLDILLNYGQGILTFVIFGLDSSPICDQIHKWFNWRADARLELPPEDQLSSATRHVCDQFATYHWESCRNEICFEMSTNSLVESVFKGYDLVGWLTAAGLAPDRKLAENYARHLLLGRFIEHVTRAQHFHDTSYLYRFCAQISPSKLLDD